MNNVGAITPGVRLHDLPQGTVEERIRMAGELGFSCIQLPSKVLYASMGIDRSGLTRELADHLRAVLDEAAAFLLERETITGGEFMQILRKYETKD